MVTINNVCNSKVDKGLYYGFNMCNLDLYFGYL